jgi:hypothetical protein
VTSVPVLHDRERGSSTVELLGVLPVVVVVLLALLQTVAVTYTTHATNQAVRDGARALSLGRPVAVAVDRSLPGGLHADRITFPDGGVRLEVKVPRIAVFPEMTVTREAAMPRTAP